MYSRIIYSILAMVSCITSTYGQDIDVQFRHFADKIEHAQSIYFKSNVAIDYVNEKPFNQSVVYERTTESIYYKTMNMEMIADRKISLMIYSENKKIVWQQSGHDKEHQIETTIMPSDTLLQKNDSIVYKGIINNAHTYTIYSRKKYIQKAEFSFDVTTGLLKRAVYEYNQLAKFGIEKTTLTFIEFSVNESRKINIPVHSVVKYENKKYTLMPEYAGYELINIDPKY